MKSTKKSAAPETQLGTVGLPGAAPAPRPQSISDMLNSDFQAFCVAEYPDAWNEPEDQKILRSVWMAATRQAVARLSFVGNAPIHAAAESEYNKLKD